MMCNIMPWKEELTMIDGQEIFKCCESCKFCRAECESDKMYLVCICEDSDNYFNYVAASEGCIEWECGFYDD